MGKFRLFASLMLAFVLSLQPKTGKAQIFDPVKWSFKVHELPNDQAALLLTATIDKGWHVYSKDLPTDKGPLPTTFTFNKSADYQKVGDIQEQKPITKYDPNFDENLKFFEDSATWKLIIKKQSKKDFKVTGTLNFMVCNSERCLPPSDVNFSFNVSGASGDATTGQSDNSSQLFQQASDNSGLNSAGSSSSSQSGIVEPVKWNTSIHMLGGDSAELVFKASINSNWHLYSQHLENDNGPIPTSFDFDPDSSIQFLDDMQEPKAISEYEKVFDMNVRFFKDSATFTRKVKILTSKGDTIKGKINFQACDNERCVFPQPLEFAIAVPELRNAAADTSGKKTKSIWGILILGLSAGFLAVLTPCVYPMLPMTVSFFTKQSKTKAAGVRNAILYGIFIILIYVVLGLAISIIFGADALNRIATNPWLNIFLFLLFFIFALSFFGAFEITLPNSWVNKADRQADRGGMLGIFFMALTLALVSFSCTVPNVGLALSGAANGSYLGPVVAMLGFSFALSLPFMLFAAFPGWLNSLPQSGGWLNAVKVTLGFVEFALAFKFLSNADLVTQSHILTREVFIAIWIAVFGAMAFYLFGKIKTPHDSNTEKIGVGRLVLGIITLAFTIYLIPGLWGAPLKLISGFPPPSFYAEAPNGFHANVAVNSSSNSTELATHSNANKSSNEDAAPAPQCPLGLDCFHDYDKALAYARKVKKPLMIDFTGWACVNCRQMENNVWSDPRVLSILKNDVVLVSLYVDDRRPLPKSEQKTVSIGSRTTTLETIGNKWSYLQASRYNSNSQPQYILLDNHEKELNDPNAFNLDIPEYLDWLQTGIKKFNMREGK